MPLAAIDSFTPLCEEPADFDEFWATTRDSLDEVEANPVLARQKPPREDLVYDQLTFTSLHGVSISGYLLKHADAEPRPLVVHSHGYNSQYDVMLHWANTGCNVLGIDFRGFGRSSKVALAKRSYVMTGIESPQTSIIRGTVADMVQALRVARELLGHRLSSLTAYGFSFGGAMAMMAGWLDGKADLVVAGQPTFGWHSERLRLSAAGTGAEIRRYIEENPKKKDGVMATLSYFDTMHFARRLETPLFIGVGLDDAIVPSRSVIAIANQVETPDFEMRILPVAHSDDPRESLWATFDEEWLAYSNDGLPSDFGDESRKLRAIEA